MSSVAKTNELPVWKLASEQRVEINEIIDTVAHDAQKESSQVEQIVLRAANKNPVSTEEQQIYETFLLKFSQTIPTAESEVAETHLRQLIELPDSREATETDDPVIDRLKKLQVLEAAYQNTSEEFRCSVEQARSFFVEDLMPDVKQTHKVLNFGFRLGIWFAAVAFLGSVLILALFAGRAVFLEPELVKNSQINEKFEPGLAQLNTFVALGKTKIAFLACGAVAGIALAGVGFSLFLIGVKGEMDLEAASEQVSIKLARFSPGVIVILCGVILIGICTTRGFSIDSKIPGVSESPKKPPEESPKKPKKKPSKDASKEGQANRANEQPAPNNQSTMNAAFNGDATVLDLLPQDECKDLLNENVRDEQVKFCKEKARVLQGMLGRWEKQLAFEKEAKEKSKLQRKKGCALLTLDLLEAFSEKKPAKADWIIKQLDKEKASEHTPEFKHVVSILNEMRLSINN